MGQCTQCIKRDCGFPNQNFKGRTPEEYEKYLREVFFIIFSGVLFSNPRKFQENI